MTAAVVEAVRQRWVDEIETPQGLDVVHDNAPAGGEAKATRHEFAVVTDNPERQVASGEAGHRRYRIVGRGIATLRCGHEKGDADLLALGDAIRAAFRGVTNADPIIEYGSPAFVGKLTRSDNGVARVMHIPFEADVFG